MIFKIQVLSRDTEDFFIEKALFFLTFNGVRDIIYLLKEEMLMITILIALIAALPSYSREIREWYILLKKSPKKKKGKK